MRLPALVIMSLLAFLIGEVHGQEHVDSLKRIGRKFYGARKYDSAIFYQKKVVSLYEQGKDQIKTSNALNDLGVYYYSKGDLDNSLYFYERAKVLDIQIGDPQRLVEINVNMGMTKKRMGDYIGSMKSYTEALDISNSLESNRRAGTIMMSIANLLIAQNKPAEALDYYRSALINLMRARDSLGYARALGNMGSVHFQNGDYDSAHYFYKRSLAMKLSLDQRHDVSSNQNNLGEVYLKLNMPDSASHYFKIAFDTRMNSGDFRGMALTANNLAKLSIISGDYLTAKNWLDRGKENLDKSGSRKLLSENHGLRAQMYDSLRVLDSAYKYFKLHEVLKDSLFQTEKLAVLDQLSAYEKGVIEAQREQAEQEADTQRLINRQQSYLMLAILGLFLISCTFLISIFRSRKKLEKLNALLDDRNQKVTQLNTELKTLNQEVKHRKQNDYNRLLSTIDIMEDEALESNDLLSPLQSVVYAAYDIDDFLDQNDNTGILYLDLYLKELVGRLQTAHQLARKDIHIETEVQHILVEAKKASTLAFILSELVNNTAKYALTDAGEVKVLLKIKKQGDEKVIFDYSDNGQDEQAADKLSASRGLGWSILEMFTSSLGSKMTVTRELGRTCFRFTFVHKTEP